MTSETEDEGRKADGGGVTPPASGFRLPTSVSHRQALAAATALLRAAGSESPRLDAEVLLAHVRGWDRARLYAGLAEPLAAGDAAAFAALVERRAAGEPVAYLTGHREFMGLDFAVGPGVLVPRPETECLVEWLLARARGRWPAPRVADVGTGSGAIALALAYHLPGARVVGVERSAAALAYAAENRRLGLARRVALVRGDLLGPVGAVDVVAANLPYLRPAQMHRGIAAEPREALLGGADGLDAYRALLPQAAARLATPGLLALELDPGQAAALAALCRAAFPGAAVDVGHDLAGLARFVTVER
ncbi:MAG TPA: peptide chain release factor N(5)-glutamine methyltransferase [Thermomicrobiales bacterium]|nr:peptide chain release factor N(5)-glutamine methyltransferase [Thermomicrobiales bacterium]